MAEKAGEVFIEVTARIDALERQLAAAKTVAAKEGGKSGFDFGAKFGEQAKGVVGTLAGPMMAAGLAKAAASVLRSDKSMPDAILDGLKTIPFVGAFADLGSAIYDATFGAADKAAEDLIKRQADARSSKQRAAADAEKEFATGQAAAGELVLERERLKLTDDLNAAKRSGDEAAVARAEYELKLRQQEFELALRIANGITDIELNALLKLNAEKKRQYAQERDLRLQQIDEQAAKQRAADSEKAQREAAAIEKSKVAAEDDVRRARLRNREAAAAAAGDTDAVRQIAREREALERQIERERALRDAASEEERDAIRERFTLEEQTAKLRERTEDAAMRASRQMGTAQTALGSFTFDPYPPQQQKTIQERTANATERMAQALGTFGVF